MMTPIMKGKPAFDDERYNLWYFLVRLVDVLQRVRQRELGKYGLTLAKSGVLMFIHSMEDAVTPAEIARWLHREPHSVSALLTRMEGEGLIIKKKDMPGKYQVRVVLTKKGLQAYEKTLDRQQIYRIMSVLAEEEHKQLGLYLEKIRNKAHEELNMQQAQPKLEF